MQVTFLGTGTSAGIPLIGCRCEVCNSSDSRDHRLRCSALIKDGDLNIVIDLGPDFRQQLLREKIEKVDAVLITHPHRDHIGGLDEIRALNFTMQQPIDIYCDGFSELGIRELHPYVFATKSDYPYLPQLNFVRIENKPFTIGHLQITPIQVMHAAMPVKGFRIKDFAYITDCKTISNVEKEKLAGVKTLVVNALRDEEHYSHFTFAQAIEFVNEIKPESSYFIHMSHQAGLHEHRQQLLPHGMFLAYDGLMLEV
jgi:phosphoribosyl 1,2-cyclic phosphate phosphodiesterase